MEKVGLVIPTLNAGDKLAKLLESIAIQKEHISSVLIIDSGSADNTVALAKKYQCETMTIDKAEFNHGGTRQRAIDYFSNIEIAIFVTQDVILEDENSISKLVNAFNNPRVGAAYGRQLPHLNASPLAAQARLFNYPPESKLKSYEDKNKLGIKTAFLSDSFAAYRLTSFEAVGGFPNHVIVSEDMYVAAKMLIQGYQIAYVADSCVYHSHDYTIWQEFKRYFDIGVFQAQEAWIRENFGGAEGEGIRLVKEQLKFLLQHNGIGYIPKAILTNAVKLIGYQLGLYEGLIPKGIKRALSEQGYFFR